MTHDETSQVHRTAYDNALDELLGIRSKNQTAIEKIPSKELERVERPITRHGRNQETFLSTEDSTPLYVKPNVINKNGVIVERWLREDNDDENDDDEDNDDSDNGNESGSKKEDNNENSRSNSEENEYFDERFSSDSSSEDETGKMEAIDNKNELTIRELVHEKLQLTNDIINTDNNDQSLKQSLNHSSDKKLIQSTKMTRQVIKKNDITGKNKTMEAESSDKSQSSLSSKSKAYNAAMRRDLDLQSLTRESDQSSAYAKATYDTWLRAKSQQEREKRRKQKEEEEEAKKVKELRIKEAQRQYEIWRERADEAMRERKKKEKIREKALVRKKMEETRKKREESTKMFQAWKSERLQKINKERQERLRNLEKEKLKQKQEKDEKTQEAQKAFNTWCEEKKIKNEKVQRKQLESKKTMEVQNKNQKEYKEVLAKEAYDVWLQIKKNERRFNESLRGRILKLDEISRHSQLIPWIPPKNVSSRQFAAKHSREHQSTKRSVNTMRRKVPEVFHRSKSALR